MNRARHVSVVCVSSEPGKHILFYFFFCSLRGRPGRRRSKYYVGHWEFRARLLDAPWINILRAGGNSCPVTPPQPPQHRRPGRVYRDKDGLFARHLPASISEVVMQWRPTLVFVDVFDYLFDRWWRKKPPRMANTLYCGRTRTFFFRFVLRTAKFRPDKKTTRLATQRI